MKVLVDTSALYALLDEDDQAHSRAVAAWRELLRESVLMTHNYVIVEALQLVRRRLGVRAPSVMADDLLPSIETEWVDDATHAAALEAWRGAGWSGSLVDQVSFVLMRRYAIDTAFAYDRDFETAGFKLASARSRPDPSRPSESPAPYGDVPYGADLVGVAEIAARSRRSTSTIQSWRRRDATFPQPFADLAAGPIWHWALIDRWIRSEPRRHLT